MAMEHNFAKRWHDYQASKTVLFWCCAASVVATIVVGFGWGGWVKGGTADNMATSAAAGARAELAANICAYSFMNGADAPAKLVSLKATESWKRDTMIEEGGWAKMPGTEKSVSGAASLCVERLMSETPVKSAAAAG
jgi:alpha/beta superfamily hydrolase